MADLHDLTALEQAAALSAGEVSSRDLVDHHLVRVAAHGDRLGAFVTVTAPEARAAAEASDDRRRRGEPLGPLDGVPTAVKDLHPTAGIRTTFGSAAFADHVPDTSDEVVLRIERAGLVSLGKTATPELGSPCYTEAEGMPPTVTPYDTTRMAGGSSGGAAAAVSAGLVPVAQASDGGGSIRIPASCCGVVGLKPSRGRVSGAPAYGDSSGLGVVGPIGRTVRDAAALLDVLAGPSVGDPTWAAPPATTFLDACDRPPGRLRVARFRTPMIAETDLHPACVQAWEDASALLEGLGHEVEDVPVPLPPEAVPVFETVWSVLTAQGVAMVPEDDRHLLRPLTRWLGARGAEVGAVEFAGALARMRQLAAATVQALDPYDAVLTPTLAEPPLPVGALRDDDDPAADFEAQKRFTPFTSPWNVTGVPAVSLPLHSTGSGLPVGVMLAGRPAGEEGLLGLAAQVEEARPWARTHPPGW